MFFMMNGQEIVSIQMRLAHLMEEFFYEINEETKETFSAVVSMTTEEAVAYMANFVYTNGYGGCIHFACMLYELICSKYEITLAYVPHTDIDTGTTSSKFINVIDGQYVLDFITPLEELKNPSIITLLRSYLVIPIDEYIQQHLGKGESLTVLPPPATQKEMPFMEYCFKNPEATVYPWEIEKHRPQENF